MRILLSDKRRVRRLCLCAMLTASALMLSYIELLLPLPIALPGVKIGLANVAVTLAFALSPVDALAVSLARIFVFALLFGTPVSLVMSLCGGALSYVFLLMMHLVGARHISFIGLSVLSALLHNAGQLVGASLLTGSTAVAVYFPVLALSAAVCGTLSGLLLNHAYPALSGCVKKAL